MGSKSWNTLGERVREQKSLAYIKLTNVMAIQKVELLQRDCNIFDEPNISILWKKKSFQKSK